MIYRVTVYNIFVELWSPFTRTTFDSTIENHPSYIRSFKIFEYTCRYFLATMCHVLDLEKARFFALISWTSPGFEINWSRHSTSEFTSLGRKSSPPAPSSISSRNTGRSDIIVAFPKLATVWKAPLVPVFETYGKTVMSPFEKKLGSSASGM